MSNGFDTIFDLLKPALDVVSMASISDRDKYVGYHPAYDKTMSRINIPFLDRNYTLRARLLEISSQWGLFPNEFFIVKPIEDGRKRILICKSLKETHHKVSSLSVISMITCSEELAEFASSR